MKHLKWATLGLFLVIILTSFDDYHIKDIKVTRYAKDYYLINSTRFVIRTEFCLLQASSSNKAHIFNYNPMKRVKGQLRIKRRECSIIEIYRSSIPIYNLESFKKALDNGNLRATRLDINNLGIK